MRDNAIQEDKFRRKLQLWDLFMFFLLTKRNKLIAKTYSFIFRQKQAGINKDKVMKLRFKILLGMTASFFLPACFFNPGGVNTQFNLPSVGSTVAPSDSELFYVDVNVKAYENANLSIPYYEISTTEEYGDSISRDSPSNCEIEYTPVDEDEAVEPANTSETKICIIDVPEWEFIVKPFHITYNFPAGMCEYTSVALPWHFNHPILPGPFVAECDLPGSSGDEGGTGYRDTLGSSRCVEDENYLCPGDVKCCYGGAKKDGSKWEPEEECFGGPGPLVYSYPNFKKRYITPMPEKGLRDSISLKSLISINGAESLNGSSTSIPFANYLEALDVTVDELETVRRADLPAFLQAGAYPSIPRLFFEFTCFDPAGETPHQLLVMIREWNTFEEFLTFYNSGGEEESDPDVEGEEGDECKYESRNFLSGGLSSQCNDMLDFDDCATISQRSGNYGAWCNHSTGTFPQIRYSEKTEEEEEETEDNAP